MNRAPVLSVPRPSRVKAYLSARVEPPVIEPSALAHVLDSYGMRAVGRRRNLRLGRRSSNVVLDTDHGLKVVKRYRPQWSEPTVRCGHSILVALEERDFAAVRLTRTPTGTTWISLDDHVFGVFDFLPGVNYSLTYLRRGDRMSLTTTAGGTLARMHLAIRDFVPEGRHHMGLASPTGPHRRDLAWHEAAIADLTRRSEALLDSEAPGGAVAASHARSLMQQACAVLERIEELERALAVADLTRLVIHGDYGLHNLIFRAVDAAVPVDFELARLDWRVNDLISVLGKYRYSNGDHDHESMEAFLAAYRTEFPLVPDEQRLFPEAWRLYKLRAAIQYWRSYFETGGPVRKLESAVDSIAQAEVVPPCVPTRNDDR
jgi:Ser/Thr protein kinase RdoA (MazF antagonist)